MVVTAIARELSYRQTERHTFEGYLCMLNYALVCRTPIQQKSVTLWFTSLCMINTYLISLRVEWNNVSPLDEEGDVCTRDVGDFMGNKPKSQVK
jgi:hypothetical protein